MNANILFSFTEFGRFNVLTWNIYRDTIRDTIKDTFGDAIGLTSGDTAGYTNVEWGKMLRLKCLEDEKDKI